MTKSQYQALARQAIQELLATEHAVVWPEVEAKLAERPHHRIPQGVDPHRPRGVDPHHLSTARRQLIEVGVIEEIQEPTRGGREITVLALAGRVAAKNATAFAHAAGRKRLLQARYLGWATPPPKRPNMLGDAGERVARASLTAATEASYLIIDRTAKAVTFLFGEQVPGGALDAAAYLTVEVSHNPLVLTLLIEVKNVRHWIYPESEELYQLLDKAAQLQMRHLARPFVPILVCRRAHYTTFKMAKDLGFVVFDTIIQPILPHSDVDPDALAEVCGELGYNLLRTDQALPRLSDDFNRTLLRQGPQVARRWAETASVLADSFQTLRKSLPRSERRAAGERLRDRASKELGSSGGW